MNDLDALSAAVRLVAYGFQPSATPGRSDGEYRALIERYHTDPEFAQMVPVVASAFDLTVVAVTGRAGIVLGTTSETHFSFKVGDHIASAPDRPIAALAHLAIAARAFPKAADLDDEGQVARITVDQVDEMVEATAQELSRRVAESGDDDGVPVDRPDLVTAWRYYLRRPGVGSTKDARAQSKSRRAIINRVAKFLVENGMLRGAGDANGGTYTTTARYQILVREMASQGMLAELAELGVAANPDNAPGGQPEPELAGAGTLFEQSGEA
jgi:hypothetical protein